MEGAFGSDTYFVDNVGDTVFEYVMAGTDTVYSSVSYFLPANVERLVLTGTDDINGYGNDDANEIFGNSGANTLLGLDSDDLLDGGAGNDYLDADGGNDVLRGGVGHDNLAGGDGNDVVDGGTGDDSLMGGAGDDTYVFGAGYGQDVVSDASGNDQVLLTGGLTFADVTLERAFDDLIVRVNGTSDQLTLSGWFTPDAQIESIAFDGGAVLDAAAIEDLLAPVVPANEQPVAADDAVAMDANAGPATGNVLGNDTDPNAGDVLAVANAGVYDGAHGTLALQSDGSYTYTPDAGLEALAAGDTVTDSFGYTVTDGASTPLADDGELRFTITGVNDAPVLAAAMADQSAQAGTAFSFALPAGAFTDPDQGEALVLGATLADGSALPAWLTFDAASGTFSGTASAGDVGTLQLQVTATDGSGETASDLFAFAVTAPPPPPPAEEEPAPLGRHIVGTRRKNHLDGTSGDDLIEGRKGNDVIHGKGGTDFLRGEDGNDELVDRRGGNVFDGGHGNDRMTGGRDDDFFAGGRGNDRLTLGGGHDVVAFNKGDGVDRLFGARQDGVLSLGGGIRYEDLKFSKQGADLVLKVGGGDRIVLEDWYRGKQSVVTLQVVAEAMRGFSQGSCDPLRDDKVETFDFRKLVAAYDDARECRRNLQNWKLMNELLDAHLGGSDTAAYGGDVAYRYGMTGTLANVGWAAARDTVAAPQFGTALQVTPSTDDSQTPT
jgi:VCBS repeat-containing protein